MYEKAAEHQPLLGAIDGMESISTQKSTPTISAMAESQTFPSLDFTRAKTSRDRAKPQCIAHRGYKAKYAENTLLAFQAAIDEGGADAIETDIHLTKDDVVVLSHDTDLKRCFGRTERIIECDWNFLSQLRTIKSPQEGMPRLSDLLRYMSHQTRQNKWILLDIKLDNDAEKVMTLIAETLASVESGPRSWHSRVVLGIWAAKYLDLCVKYLTGYPVAYIGFSTCYARQFFKVPNVGFNILATPLLGPIGTRFVRDVHSIERPLYLWTVNDTGMMKWAISKGVSGVITDDPKLYNEVADAYQGEKVHITWSQWLYTFWLYVLLALFSIPLKHRLPGSADKFLKGELLRTQARLALGA